ncbi:MAG: RsmE family RNA methyltransferase [Mycoplasmataceae bacterium]|nr:RsmE family RNA methyltransferase [Mycoplasmataceae bacterium]
MHRFFIFNHQENPTKIIIPDKDLNHQLKRVLRIGNNEKIICIYKNYELSGNYINDQIKIINVEKFTIIKTKPIVNLIQAIPHPRKIPLILQKSTELNVDCIFLIPTKRSLINLDKVILKDERYKRIIIEASEQTGRNDLPKLKYIHSFADFSINNNDLVLVLFENERKTKLINSLIDLDRYENIYLIIGPEGGFTLDEIKYFTKRKWIIVTTGKNILRTETATYYALSLVQAIKNK